MRTQFKSLLFFISSILFLAGCATTKKAEVVSLPTTPTAEQRPALSGQPHKIALLLPLKGKYAEKSQAIRNGFLAAYYSDDQNKSGINVRVIDTSNKDIANVYNETAAAGIDMIVGPLTKPDVNTIAQLDTLKVPTLALNTLDDYQNKLIVNLYQFGLLPQDEALQAADKIFKDGHNQVAIVAPNSTAARNVVNIFKNKYESLGGKIITTTNFYTVDYDNQVRQLLGIDADQLKHRQNNEPIKHRDDINAIFLVASPEEARLIAPLFKYYADDIKVYATSSVYSGIPNATLDSDLNGVIFCDMPWVIKNPNDLAVQWRDLRNKISTLWSGSFNANPKLYALGIDAYKLAISLNQLINSPTTGIDGISGTLTLDNGNHVYRELLWSEFQNGIPKPI